MNHHGLCAPTTSIVDFAYPEGHPLRLGNYPTSSRSSLTSDGDEDYYDDGDQQLMYPSDEINSRARALFDFRPENDNEVALKEGQLIWISYRHGQGWLVAEDPNTGENGLVPEEYVEIFFNDDSDEVPKQYIPEVLQNFEARNESDNEWVDTDDEADPQNHDSSPEELEEKMGSLDVN